MSILKQSAVYGLSNGLIALSQFGMSLVFSKLLSTDGFGIYSIFLVCYMAFSMLIGMGLPAAVQRYYFEMNPEGFKVLLSTVIKAIFYFSLLVAFVVSISPLALTKYFLIEKKWLILSILAALGQVLIQIVLMVLQSQKRVSEYLLFVFLQVIISLSAGLAFYYYRTHSWGLAILSQSASSIIIGLVVVIFTIHDGNKMNTWSTILFRNAIKYSSPLVPHQLSSWIMTMADRFIIGNIFGVGVVGVYSLSFQIAQSFNIVSNSLNQAVVPMLFQKLAEPFPNFHEIKKINFYYVVSLIAFFFLFIIMFYYISPYFITEEYKLISQYTPLILFSFLLLAISRISSNYLMYEMKTKMLALVTIISSVLSISLNLMLVPYFGAISACWVSVGSFLFLLILTTWYAYQYET